VNENWENIFELAETSTVKDKNTYIRFADALSEMLPRGK